LLVTVIQWSTAQQRSMDELTAEPDADEPKRKRTRHQKGAVHVFSRQDDSNPQDSVEPADNHDTSRPRVVVETSQKCVVETSAPRLLYNVHAVRLDGWQCLPMRKFRGVGENLPTVFGRFWSKVHQI